MKTIMLMLLSLSFTQVTHSENSLGHNHSRAPIYNKPSLDHGAKWKMDSHTRNMFASMSERIDAGGDLKKMGGQLNEDLQKLIQGCTMTGAAHDQLHLFLAPYITAINELSQQGTEEALEEAKHRLHDYQNYFE